MKMINVKVDNFIEDEEKTALLKNIDKAATVFKTTGSKTFNSGRTKYSSGTEDANLATPYSIDTDTS